MQEYNTENAKTYEGTKRINAWPMNRADYNTYRGWEPPGDENGEDAGYLVEYLDQPGRSNHPKHDGYISWSPADVFEGTYKEIHSINDWRTRLAVEAADLAARLTKLRDFMSTEAFDNLPHVDRELLREQAEHMQSYSEVLLARMSRADMLGKQGPADGQVPYLPAAENNALTEEGDSESQSFEEAHD
jgi:hypothetical protein